MASGKFTSDVRITVGNVGAVVGAVDIPLKLAAGEVVNGHLPVSASVDMDGFKANLAEFLRDVVYEIEQQIGVEHGD